MALNTVNPYTQIPFFSSAGKQETEVLLVKRLLIQKWTGGRSSNPEIPQWAGQWGGICARPEALQPIDKTAYAALFAQTGINLNDPLVAEKYQIKTIQPETLQDVNYNPVPVDREAPDLVSGTTPAESDSLIQLLYT